MEPTLTMEAGGRQDTHDLAIKWAGFVYPTGMVRIPGLVSFSRNAATEQDHSTNVSRRPNLEGEGTKGGIVPAVNVEDIIQK